MTRQRLRLAAGLALSTALWTASAGASIATYPFRVESHKVGELQIVRGVNQGPAPIWVRLALKDTENIQSNKPWPIGVLVAPGETLDIASIFAADRSRPFRFGLNTAFSLGDPGSQHDRAANYRLPFADGLVFPISQAPGGTVTSHTTPASQYAVDITMPVGTPIVAARAGTVVDIDLAHQDSGQDTSLLDKANVIQILHADGTIAIYAHLKPGRPMVQAGQRVRSGQQIGWSGNTGYSSGPHLHFAVLKNVAEASGHTHMQSLEFRFTVHGNAFAPTQGMSVVADYAAPAGETPEVHHAAADVSRPGPIALFKTWTADGPLSAFSAWMDSRPPAFWPLMIIEGIFIHLMVRVYRKLARN